jgi:hypothetical protein
MNSLSQPPLFSNASSLGSNEQGHAHLRGTLTIVGCRDCGRCITEDRARAAFKAETLGRLRYLLGLFTLSL